jgi:hypothetical protein
VSRRFRLSHGNHQLQIENHFDGLGEHVIEIPLHLAPGISAKLIEEELVQVKTETDELFHLQWEGDGYALEIGESRVSPSYGRIKQVTRLLWSYKGQLPASCTIWLSQHSGS